MCMLLSKVPTRPASVSDESGFTTRLCPGGAPTCVQGCLERAATDAQDDAPPANTRQQLGHLLSRLLLCHRAASLFRSAIATQCTRACVHEKGEK